VQSNPLKLVAFDMEGCLTDDPTVWEIMHRKLGTWESHGEPYWRRYRAHEFGYDEFARMDVAVWRGAPVSLLDEAAAEVALMPGCAELIEGLTSAGVAVAVVSNGLLCVAERFRRDHGVAHVFANRALVDRGRLTGEIELSVPFAAKGDALRGLAAQLGLNRAEVAAVGDGPADVGMFRAARIAVAFRPSDPLVADAATHVVRERDLRRVLKILTAGPRNTADRG